MCFQKEPLSVVAPSAPTNEPRELTFALRRFWISGSVEQPKEIVVLPTLAPYREYSL